MFHAGKQFAVRLEREQHSQGVGNNKQHRKTHAQLAHKGCRRRRIDLGHRRWDQQRNRSQEEEARLHARADPVELLHVVAHSAEEKRRAQHEQRVRDNRTSDGRFHQHVLPGAQGGERNDQFGQVSERGVEQPADRIARLSCDRFSRMTQQRGQRYDSKHG